MRRAWWATWLLLAAFLAGPASAQALRAELLFAPAALDGPPASAPAIQRIEAARPGDTVRVVLPQRRADYWLRLTTDAAVADDAGALLVLEGPQRIGAVAWYPPGAPPRMVHPAGHAQAASAQLLRRGWALTLPNGWPASSVAYLQVRSISTEPLRLRLAPAGRFAREQRSEARYMVAVFTVLLLMAAAMLAIHLVFRDLLYLSYAGYLACVATYTLLLSGDALEIAGLSYLAAYGTTGQWAIATLAVTLQLVFTRRILELDRVLPGGARFLRRLFWIHLALLATLLAGREHVHGWYYLVGNGLLIAATPLVLAVAVRAWRRGAAYAGYYLLGWTPLLAVTALSAADQLALVSAAWAEDTMPVAAVLESAVLVVALSRHAANRHRIALLARQSHERDALTGALNHEALVRMLDAWHQLGTLGARDYCVLLLDLDDFAELNARHGRAVGDAVLQQMLARMRSVLRPDDTIARHAGDCFAVVSECARADGEALARRLADMLAARPFRIDGQSIAISVSVGFAVSARGEPVAALLQRAADALQRAHAAGRNVVSVAADADAATAPVPMHTRHSPA